MEKQKARSHVRWPVLMGFPRVRPSNAAAVNIGTNQEVFMLSDAIQQNERISFVGDGGHRPHLQTKKVSHNICVLKVKPAILV
jgi:hypothetical protein